MTCVQCGHPHPALIAGLSRRPRYSCRVCGAVFRPGSLPGTEPPAPAGSAPLLEPEPLAPADEDPLAVFMPERMVRWVREQGRAPDTSGAADAPDIPGAPDRATLARWYKEWDALVAAARSDPEARATLGRVSEIPADRLPAKLPAFAKVCAALHATCYDARLAGERLGGEDDPFVTERVGHLRRWLATAGRATTWLEAPPAPPPEPETVRSLLTMEGSFTREQAAAFFAALFGVDKGPSIPGVRARFGDERVHEALRSYLESGARPLRETVAAELDAT
ncbi:hypothetical protein ACQEUU_34650 [Nonomuraea sp. CA-218870]|uniref:hypothetical protein n=1 Tax=Nonomuraea sp. CA-218870 TaxID=3239998 RepID=UPI003D936A5E